MFLCLLVRLLTWKLCRTMIARWVMKAVKISGDRKIVFTVRTAFSFGLRKMIEMIEWPARELFWFTPLSSLVAVEWSWGEKSSKDGWRSTPMLILITGKETAINHLCPSDGTRPLKISFSFFTALTIRMKNSLEEEENWQNLFVSSWTQIYFSFYLFAKVWACSIKMFAVLQQNR